MGIFDFIFGKRPYPPQHQQQVEKLLDELQRIGAKDDFLSERPGGQYNLQCRHIRAREIGVRLDEIGGLELMEYAQRRVKKKTSTEMADHLGYCWTDIGRWIP